MRRILLNLGLVFALSMPAVLAAVSTSGQSLACTTAQHIGPDGPLVAKSYDWDSDDGLVFFNAVGVQKSGLVFDGSTPVQWTSRFGSLTFNQYGKELPNGGMNTEGLVVEVMWLPGTKTPARDERPALNELQWIQYQLDRFSRVDEVVKHAGRIRVARIHGKVHYLVCDSGGECAAFDYADGRLEIHHGESLPTPVLTNHTYKRSMGQLDVTGDTAGSGSLQRFGRTSRRIAALSGSATVADAFKTLDDVSVGERSVWNIVYAPKAQRVYFRTRRAQAIKSVDMVRLAAKSSCDGPSPMLPIHQQRGGDATGRFVEFRTKINRSLIRRTISELGGGLAGRRGLALADVLASLPSRFSCAEAP